MMPRFVRSASIALAVAAAFALLAAPTPVQAQEGLTTGSVTGTVVDNAGEPLVGAVVIVRNTETGDTRQVETNENGRFTVGLLRPGPYTVEANFPPLDPQTRGPVRVTVGEARSVSFALQAVEVEAIAVTIADDLTAIDATQGGVVEAVSEEQIDQLPTAGRDFTDFISLSGLISPQPEISTGGQFSIGGARTSGTNVTIDGSDANNAFFGENRGSSRIPFAFSLESIKEFQIVTNGYDVEYGRFSGGLINAVTKGGTNQHQGSFFVFGRDEALTSDNFDGTAPEDFTSIQFGGVLSGPIIEDKLHYFVSGDFQQRDQPVFTLTADRSGIAQGDIDEFLDIIGNVYGLPTEGQSGVFEETDDQIALFGRLDWNVNPRNRATLRVNYTDFENLNDRISGTGNEARSMGGTFLDEAISVVGELNSILNAEGNIYNTLRLHYSDEQRPRPGNSTLPSVRVEVQDGLLQYGGNFFGILFANRLDESKFQITDNLTWQFEDHVLKVGTDNIFSNTLNRFWLNGNGFFDFDNLEDFRNGEPSFSLRFVPAGPDGLPDPNPTPPEAEFDTREYSIYAQDEWQATDRLLMSFGLRYDYTDWATTPPELAFPDFTQALADVGESRDLGPLSVTDVPSDGDNLSPRVSFTYDIEGNDRRLLRGGAGLFYARLPAVLHGNVMQITPQPLMQVVCIAAATPEFNYGDWEDPANIPTDCAFEFQGDPFGLGIIDAPETVVWDEDLEMPETWKANLGYEQRLGDRFKVGAQAIYSRTENNFHVKSLNLQQAPTDEIGGGVFTNAEGRPVFIDPVDYEPDGAPLAGDVAQNSDLASLYYQTDTGVGEIWNLKFDLHGRVSENLQFGGNYTWTHAFDNSSFVCCTANAGVFDIPTAGNPNFIGDFGDEEDGAWGPSDFERRHVFVAHGIWNGPAGIDVGVIYRAQSGNPFTPSVFGDLNADTNDGNDRPFIPDPNNVQDVQLVQVDQQGNIIPGSGPAAEAEYAEVLAQDDNECLREAVGSIINRNTCNNPWWHSVDLKLAKSFGIVSGQELELTLDLFNVLDAVGLDAGEFVFKRDALFRAEGFDPDTGEVIYSVFDNYGEELPVGFGQLQFQAQLGARYRF